MGNNETYAENTSTGARGAGEEEAFENEGDDKKPRRAPVDRATIEEFQGPGAAGAIRVTITAAIAVVVAIAVMAGGTARPNVVGVTFGAAAAVAALYFFSTTEYEPAPTRPDEPASP